MAQLLKKKAKKTPFQVLRETLHDKSNKPISRNELAKRLERYCPGIDEKKIERIENGRVKSIDIDTFKAYMQYFGVSADFLMGFSNIPKRFDNDVIGCANYLGLSRKAVETIHKMFGARQFDSSELSQDASTFMSKYYEKTENDLRQAITPNYDLFLNDAEKLNEIENDRKKIQHDFEQIVKKSGFAFDLLLSSPGFSSLELFYCIYRMIQKRADYLVDYQNDFPDSYKIHLFDMIELIQNYIEQLDESSIMAHAIDFDRLYDSDIQHDVFGVRS